ncbi:hypothetical protein [Paenibacillus ginsengihumi]|uniref:hypothetical protein n=1 Tax=Paenibacillus ginsengihumi TaxID=431596 RepID=UPI0004767A30|nr:hypothetical protein [Paenibacillus ginsengihumi]
MRTYDLSGQRFGRLVAKRIIGKAAKNSNVWILDCDCGGQAQASTHNLIQGHVRSCGCLKKDTDRINLEQSMLDKTVDGVRVPLLSQKIRSDNSSGHKGVSFDKRSGKWRAYIGIKGKFIDLGLYSDIADAVAARKAGEEKYHAPYIDTET